MRAAARPALFDASTQHRRALLAKVHVAKKVLGLDDDTYRAVLLRVAGETSAAKCSDAQLVALVKEFEAKGFTAKAKKPSPRPADHPLALKARAMWISLHQLGRNPPEFFERPTWKQSHHLQRMRQSLQMHFQPK